MLEAAGVYFCLSKSSVHSNSKDSEELEGPQVRHQALAQNQLSLWKQRQSGVNEQSVFSTPTGQGGSAVTQVWKPL